MFIYKDCYMMLVEITNSISVSDHLCFHLCVCAFQREEEIARRQAVKEKKEKEREERLKASKQPDLEQEEEEEEEEEELPPIYIPDPPSPLYCGFYSQPGQFWLSMVHTNTPSNTHTHYVCHVTAQLYLDSQETIITRIFKEIT